MMPPNAHMSLQVCSSAGMLPTSTPGAPGTQGPAGTGVQGIGVSARSAAAVAAATAGLARLEQVAKGKTFTKGMVSTMLATGAGVSGRPTGSTINDEGAAPNEHCKTAPALTSKPMG